MTTTMPPLPRTLKRTLKREEVSQGALCNLADLHNSWVEYDGDYGVLKRKVDGVTYYAYSPLGVSE